MKSDARHSRLGAHLSSMLEQLSDRGPDSAGVAFYREPAPPGSCKVSLHSAAPEPGWEELAVYALREGDRISPRETVLLIEGDYSLFAHLETVYLGCLARRSLIMRNVSDVVRVDGRPCAKVGRKYAPNPRLERVE